MAGGKYKVFDIVAEIGVAMEGDDSTETEASEVFPESDAPTSTRSPLAEVDVWGLVAFVCCDDGLAATALPLAMAAFLAIKAAWDGEGLPDRGTAGVVVLGVGE